MRDKQTNKIPVGFRFAQETIEVLDAITGRTKISKTQLIEDALSIFLAAERERISPELAGRRDTARTAYEQSLATHGARLHRRLRGGIAREFGASYAKVQEVFDKIVEQSSQAVQQGPSSEAPAPEPPKAKRRGAGRQKT